MAWSQHKMAPLALLAMLVVADAFLVLPGSQMMAPALQKGGFATRSSLRVRNSIGVSRVSMMATEEKKEEIAEPTAEELSFIEKLTPTDDDGVEAAEASGGSEAEQAVGRYRRRRQAARVEQKPGISKGLRFRLLEEQASPFRRFRQFLYFAAGGSAGLGSFVSGTRVIAGLQGISGVQPLEETVPNTAINVAVLAVSLGLFLWEENRGQKDIKKLSEKSGVMQQLAALDVELNDGTKTDLRGLRESKRLVILAGTAAEVTRSINLASRQGSDLMRCDMAVVPLFTDLDDDSAGWTAMKAGSGTGMWDPFLIRPLGREAWKAWLKTDRKLQEEKRGETKDEVGGRAPGGAKPSASVDRLLRVYIIRKDGKIGARTVGPPAWPKLVKQVERLPLTDQYGTP